MIFKHLMFSIFLLGFWPEEFQDPCQNIRVTWEVENDIDQNGSGRVMIKVEGAGTPIKYFFSNQEGHLINSDFSKGSMERLAKGSYTCLVKEKGGCRKKIEFQIK